MPFTHDFTVNTWIRVWASTWYLLIELHGEVTWSSYSPSPPTPPALTCTHQLPGLQFFVNHTAGMKMVTKGDGRSCRSRDPSVHVSPSTRRWEHAGGGRKWLFPRKGRGLKTHLADGPSRLWQSENDFNKIFTSSPLTEVNSTVDARFEAGDLITL